MQSYIKITKNHEFLGVLFLYKKSEETLHESLENGLNSYFI
jgi:hypothetical protein